LCHLGGRGGEGVVYICDGDPFDASVPTTSKTKRNDRLVVAKIKHIVE